MCVEGTHVSHQLKSNCASFICVPLSDLAVVAFAFASSAAASTVCATTEVTVFTQAVRGVLALCLRVSIMYVGLFLWVCAGVVKCNYLLLIADW